MKLDKKTAYRMLPVFALFALAIASLMLSGLSVENAVSMQNEVTAVFLKSVQSSIIAAIANTAGFIVASAVLPLLPFLVLSVLGFFAVIWLKPDARELAISLAAVFVLSAIIAIVLGKIPLLIVFFGYSALLLPIEFEEQKTAFKTGCAFTSYMLRFANISLAAAVFFSVLLLPNFDKIAEQQMISSINTLLPDAKQLQDAQSQIASTFINQASTDVGNIIDKDYLALNQTGCSQFKDSVKADVEAYKSGVLAQLQSGGTIGTEELAQQVFSKVGIFSAIAKALPLIAALSLLVLLEILRPLLSLLGGAVYSFVSKKYG